MYLSTKLTKKGLSLAFVIIHIHVKNIILINNKNKIGIRLA